MVYCLDPNCRRTAVLNVDAYGDNVPVRWFGPRMVCTGCEVIGSDATPNWSVAHGQKCPLTKTELGQISSLSFWVRTIK